MSEIEKFVSKYSSDTKALEEKIQEIENMDISNIKKIDMIQEVKEEYKIKLPKFFKHQRNSFDNENAFERRVETGRWD